jgi:hypothetical protein
LSQGPNPFGFGYLWNRVSHFWPGLAWGCDLPVYTFCVVGNHRYMSPHPAYW